MYFYLDNVEAKKPILMNNIIKIPLVPCAEGIKDYPELTHPKTGKVGVKLFMPYESIKDGILWHKKNSPQVLITMDHVDLTDEQKTKVLDVPAKSTIGYAKSLAFDDKNRCARAMAYILKSKIPSTLVDYINRGNAVQTSIGAFYEDIIWESGTFKGERYDGIQGPARFHHFAMIIDGIARCGFPKCGFNLKDSENIIDCFRAIVKVKDQLKETGEINWSEDKILASAVNECFARHKVNTDKFDWENISEEELTELTDFLLDNEFLSHDFCPKTFRKYLVETSDSLNFDVYINNNAQDKDQLQSIKNDELNMSEELKKRIAELEAENQKLKNQDTEKQIQALGDSNEELKKTVEQLTQGYAILQKDIADKQAIIDAVTEEKKETVIKILVGTGKYSEDELKVKSLEKLVEDLENAKRFVPELQDKIVKAPPQPANQIPAMNPRELLNHMQQAQAYQTQQADSQPTTQPQPGNDIYHIPTFEEIEAEMQKEGNA